jgi:hypothetical protein
MARTQFAAGERALRSRLAKLIHEEPVLRGTLSVRHVTCGKAGCRCTQGQKHLALFLSSSREGKTRQVFIPAELETQIRQWVDNYHQVRDLLEAVSESALERLNGRKQEKHRHAPQTDKRKRS